MPEPGTLEEWEAEQAALEQEARNKPAAKSRSGGTSEPSTKKRGATKPKPLITCLSDVEPQDVAWLWHPYIPLGKLTLLEGDPGLGKTFLALTLAAAITRGWPLLSQTGAPDEELEPADVLYMSAEDGLADTLRPRLDAAGADVSRVHALTGWQLSDDAGTTEGAVSLGDIPILEQALTQTKPRLIIIDPLQAYLGAKVDMHRANEVRPLLSALGNLAEKHKCAVICIRHLSKALSPKAIYSGMGSIDFAAAARSILTVGEHDGERLLAHVKSSLAPQGKSIRYELRDGSLNWLGISDITAEELRVPQTVEAEGSTVDAAVTFLQDYLEDGPQPASSAFSAAKQEGISERTLKRAKSQLEVRSQRVSAGNEGAGKWAWSLPYNSGTLAPLRAEPVTDANPASVPSVPMERLEPLPEEREGRENPQEGKGATPLPLEIKQLHSAWKSRQLDGQRLELPGRSFGDLGRVLGTYFDGRRLNDGERADLLEVARAVAVTPEAVVR
jgi:hypothetical protein